MLLVTVHEGASKCLDGLRAKCAEYVSALHCSVQDGLGMIQMLPFTTVTLL